ncbi:MAG TPA: divalent-cation tolerance protein CutA [Firmicutes bacterium]|nr:divalent-cation tolerance protein CutA [Bacillota bacterium]
MSDNPEILIVLSTVPSVETGKSIAHILIEKKLAACVNILPSLESVYEWEGKIEESAEALLIIKTTTESYESLETEILSNHPYDVPEIIALPVTKGLKPYLEWVRSNTDKKNAGEDIKP